jgi:hypothetical protein
MRRRRKQVAGGLSSVVLALAAAACGENLAADRPVDECARGAVETRVRYEEPSVPFDDECAMEEQTRQCVHGRWSAWEGSFEHEACAVSEPRDCENPAAEHGTTNHRVRYEASEVPFGNECSAEAQTRTCGDGSWSEWTGSFAAESCTVGDPLACSDPDAGHGTTDVRSRYATPSVPFGQSCQSEEQTRTCGNGAWSEWTGSFLHETCAVDPPLACTNPDMPHGATDVRMRYSTPTVPYGSTCESEEQGRACSNGTWSEWSGSYEYETCVGAGLVAIRILPSKPVLGLGEDFFFRAVGTLDVGSDQDITSLVSWSSEDPSVVELTGSDGAAIGRANGSTIVRATAEGLETEVTAVVRDWRYRTLDSFDGFALDFSGDHQAQVLAAWVVSGSQPGGEMVKESIWENDWWDAPSVVADEDDVVPNVRAGINPLGDRHVLWTKPLRTVPPTFYVRARHRDYHTGLWSEISTLTSAGDDLKAPSLAVAHGGHSLATWFEDGAQRFASFTFRTGWEPSLTWILGRRSHAAGIDAIGNGILLATDTWLSPTAGAGVYAYHYDRATRSVGNRIPVWDTADETAPYETLGSKVRLGMDASGNAMMAWVREHGDDSALMVARYVADAGWEPASVLLDGGDAQILIGNMSVHPTGIAALAFSSNFGGQGHRVFAATFAPESGWESPTPLSTAGKFVALPELFERDTVATGYEGRAIAVWSEPVGGGLYLLRVSRYDPEIGWSVPFNLDVANSFTHESAFGLLEGWFVGYFRDGSGDRTISSYVFR